MEYNIRNEGNFEFQDSRNMSYRNDNYDPRNGRDYKLPRRDRSGSRDSGNMVAVYKKRSVRDNQGNPRDGDGKLENTLQRLDSIQDPGKRYILNEVLGTGVCGTVYSAVDLQAGNKKVAIKIQNLTADTRNFVVEEYRVFRDFSGHPNIPDFYGIYRRRSGKKNEPDQIWFVMELCDGGPVMDLVRGLKASEKKMQEEHIAYILKHVIKAMIHLHENHIIHRDIRGHNILLSKEGEVKLIDFGLARALKGELGKCKTCIGSPSWMAPEVVSSRGHPKSGYGTRADVWSIGITAIELAEGRAPFEDMHPTRTLFQIVRNPPPGLYRPANWSENFNDFITECLEKDPDNRPVMEEIMMHPFLEEVPENDYILSQELKALTLQVQEQGIVPRPQESMVANGFLKTDQSQLSEPMLTEDLANLEILTEETILDELQERLRQGHFQTFIGDVLVILNPNEIQDIYGMRFHEKYNFKSRSDDAPHIYSVADKAYQDVLHNEETQHIVFSGESNSGKTTNLLHLIRHLMYLGKSLTDIGVRVFKAIDLIHAFSHAATPHNINSTRCVLQIQTTFGTTGKASGAIFWLYQLEKWRVSTIDKNQSNFHIFYYLYDGLEAKGKLRAYKLPKGRRLRYLRIKDKNSGSKQSLETQHNPQGNSLKLEEMEETLKLMEMDEYTDFIWKILSAILLLGEVQFTEGNNGEAEVENVEIANTVAEHLGLDAKKFVWSLTNYCLIKKGAAVRRKHTCEEANIARDVFANTIYHRLVDWIVNNVNMKLSMTRTLFGDKYMISALDLFGFECFAVNRFEQLIVNTMNEQLQCYYNQRLFAWEMQEQEEEEIPVQYFHYYDNREAIEQLMGINYGLFQIIDNASRQLQDAQYIVEKLKQHSKGLYVKPISYYEFTVAHYTGKIIYDARDIIAKNRDFVPPEMINTVRLSEHEIIKQMFTNQLTKSGNLTIVTGEKKSPEKKLKFNRGVIFQEPSKLRRYNSTSRGQYSQSRKMRTCAATFRTTSLEILKNLSIGSGNGGTHFVRCVQANLDGKRRGFYRDLVRQQMRALALLDTAKSRQLGYPHRIPFPEFLRRYKFLAFDFDENVEISKDNCRLLLIRLKMEGWIIGKTKVFLKYYNEEYLSRRYETQVRKIIKIQCMLRAFLARKRLDRVNQKKKAIAKKGRLKHTPSINLTEEEAAIKIQKTYRGHAVRKEVGVKFQGGFDENTAHLMSFYCHKWRSKTIFQVLLQYRAARYQDLVQFSQQVHLFNQALGASIHSSNQRVNLDKINSSVNAEVFVTDRAQQVHKLPFDLGEEFSYFDTTYMNDPQKLRKGMGSVCSSTSDEEPEAWDIPLRRQTVPWATTTMTKRDAEVQTTNSPHHLPRRPITSGESIINTPFTRGPDTIVKLPAADLPSKDKPATVFNYEKPMNTYLPPTGHINDRPDNYNNNESIRSRKKKPPPPIPMNQMRNWNDNSNRVKGSDNWMFDDPSTGNEMLNARTNPIHELQSIGRRNSNNNNDVEDQPPFNFQAILRKTPHQRNSMKRTPIYDSQSPALSARSPMIYPRPSSPFPGEHELAYKSTNDPDSVTIYRSNSRLDSPEWSPNEMIRMSEKYSQEDAWGPHDETMNDRAWGSVSSFKLDDNYNATKPEDANANEIATDVACSLPFTGENKYEPKVTILQPDGLTRVEFAPGIVVQGYCADV